MTVKGLDREGEIMGSCVGSGSYDADLKSGATTFLSLRDAAGSPHATLQVRGRAFHEFRGKANQAPADRYRPAILWTMNRFDLPPTKMCSDLLSKLGLAWEPEAPKGRRYGPADEAGAEIGVFGGVLASRRQSKHQAEDGTIQSCGAPTYLLEGPSGRCSAVLGERLSIDGAADEAAVAALAMAAAEAGDVLPPPDPAAAELLSSLGWFHADGGYAPQMEMAKHLRTLPSGAEAKVLADHETGQQIVFYVGADGRRLATFALRRRAEVDRDRLYVLSKEEGFSGEAVSRDVVDLLEGLDVFLSDAKTASELGIVFCRLRWRYLPLRIFWEEMALELLAGDLSVRVEDDGAGGFVGTVRRVLSPVGRIHVVPQGERSPFHIVVSAKPGEGDGAAKAVVFALNRLMFPTPQDDLGDRRVVFDRSLYAYGLRRPKKKGGGGPAKEAKAPSLASKVAEALGIRRTAARLFKKGLEKAA